MFGGNGVKLEGEVEDLNVVVFYSLSPPPFLPMYTKLRPLKLTVELAC